MIFGMLSSNEVNDIHPVIRILLVLVAIVLVFLLAGCSSVPTPSPIKRMPPAADMVRLEPLPKQTDPTLGGLFKGYVNAVQHDRQCMTRLTELQDWIHGDQEK